MRAFSASAGRQEGEGALLFTGEQREEGEVRVGESERAEKEEWKERARDVLLNEGRVYL